MHPHQGHVHQGGGDHRLGNAHGNGLLAHAPQGAEPELVADDKGDKAQCHLGDYAVALHLLQGAKADAQAAEAGPFWGYFLRGAEVFAKKGWLFCGF